MPVQSTNKQVIKNDVIEANEYEVIAVHIVKPVAPDERNPARVRVVWACMLDGVDTGETVEVNLDGQDAVDYISSDFALYDNILTNATDLGKSKAVLPSDVVRKP